MESLDVKLGRIEQRLDDLVKNYTELCEHVNHENECMDSRMKNIEMNGAQVIQNAVAKITKLLEEHDERIKSLEDTRITQNGINLGRLQIYKVTIASLGLFATIISILYYLSLIGIHL